MNTRRPLRATLALWLLAALLACTQPRTQIILLIETDMQQGPAGPLTHVRVTVKTPNAPTERQRLTYPLRAPDTAGRIFELPATLGIVALDNDGSRSVEVQVAAITDTQFDGSQAVPVFTHYSIAPFEDERTLLLRVFLADRCRTAPACQPDETCGRLGCEPRQRTSLPEVPPTFRPDAEVIDVAPIDDFTPIDARTDAPIDARTDAPIDARADAPIDARIDASLDVRPDVTDGSACVAGQVRCGGECVDTATSPAHCGACDAACRGDNASGECTMGRCALVCEQGFADCDNAVANGCEVNTRTDLRHCGGCRNACNAPNATSMCAGGMCDFTCATGFGDCDGVVGNGCEVNLTNSAAHCGRCGAGCMLPHVTTAGCASARCTIVTCEAGWSDCDRNPSNGCETELRLTSAHCGRCGNACSATQLCSAGVCGDNCGALTRCGTPGACVDTQTNIAHCGRCGTVCTARINSTPTCVAGACGARCNAGFGDCDGNADNGCETSLLASTSHCGLCRAACVYTNGSAACSGGACTLDGCDAGYGNCDGRATNGCEVDLRMSALNCGACGSACDLANATPRCDGGRCAIASCNAGWGNCDSRDATGCETPLTTNSNCGGCGRSCSLPNATPRCAMGACAIASCNLNFDNCDGLPANGCETSLLTSNTHCGACGVRCLMGQSCLDGRCVAMCRPGQTLCGGVCVDTQTDLAHCGACGAVCAARPNSRSTCAGGRCGFVCNPGFADCDGIATNGCEVMLFTPTDCARCGNLCSFRNAAAFCMSGSCVMGACNSGFGNCDRDEGTGCEENVNTSTAHCGVCDNACPSGPRSVATCVSGRCGLTCESGFVDCNRDPSDGCELEFMSPCTTDGGCRLGVSVCRGGAIACDPRTTAPRCEACSLSGIDGVCNGTGTCIIDGSLICGLADGGVTADGGSMMDLLPTRDGGRE